MMWVNHRGQPTARCPFPISVMEVKGRVLARPGLKMSPSLTFGSLTPIWGCWEPPFPLLISADTWEEGVPGPSIYRLPAEDQKEQSGSACAEEKAETFINDPLSCLRDTF